MPRLIAAVRHGIASTAWVPRLFLMLVDLSDIISQMAVRGRIERLELPDRLFAPS